VAPETPITDVAKALLDAAIHRVIVVDTGHKPIGVVSGTDIVAAVAHAANMARATKACASEEAACLD